MGPSKSVLLAILVSMVACGIFEASAQRLLLAERPAQEAQQQKSNELHLSAGNTSARRPQKQPTAVQKHTTGAIKPVSASNQGKILLELFVMSRCPDARDCEFTLGRVLDKLHPIVRVHTEYIADQDNQGTVSCMHGWKECLGNAFQLCVRDNTPPEHNYDWFFKFIQCTWVAVTGVGNPTTAQACLDQLRVQGAPRAAMDACIASDQAGARLLAGSAAATRARGVTKSCTVAIEGQGRCVRDRGRWYDCPGGNSDEELTRSLCEAYKKKTGKDADVCAGVDGSSGHGTSSTRSAGEQQQEASSSSSGTSLPWGAACALGTSCALAAPYLISV